MKKEFPVEIKDKVLDLILDEYSIVDYDFNLTVGVHDEPTMTLVMNDGIQVWVINQYESNEQTLATFFIEGDNMVCATIPMEVMEISMIVRTLNHYGKFGFVWDYINEIEVDE